MTGKAVNPTNALPEELLSDLLESTQGIDPGADRAAAMLKSAKQRIQADTQLPLQDFLTVTDAGGEWVEPYPGNNIKMLRSDDDTQSFLVRLDPGTRFPPHSHPQDEETLVMEGEVMFGELHLRTGDYHLARAGSDHDETYSENGCLLFIRAGTAQNA